MNTRTYSAKNNSRQGEGGYLAVIAVVVLVILTFGCGGTGGVGPPILAPDVRVTYRSALGPGFVLNIVNSGSKPLFNVTVSCDEWGKRYIVQKQLDVGASVEAGWLELPEGCKRGKTYKISADGFPGSFYTTIPNQ